ncbi:hypothetical protein [Chitinophaga sancti]|uniref:Uncharacterized protein n=1 Tax=Chitinophaga sancti TaxID=1004 RepID=A0A1K1Q8I5_9BACT|nr:hypothetical protein [Chitinophaga sancti]WQD61245.1 hypothetical protein U0033_25515 [Chitinophaga sancti]WQG86628.1 hypothetical protein SR876_16950 [Chitinophaga sancti]SFW56258.1 hypothetical protein SAMN05661012_02553 [Chitinophaga sancti]
MANGIITFEFDIKALHYLNSNSRFIRATADANGNIDIAAAALQYYNMTNTHFDMELESEEDVDRFKHVARRFFSGFSEN